MWWTAEQEDILYKHVTVSKLYWSSVPVMEGLLCRHESGSLPDRCMPSRYVLHYWWTPSPPDRHVVYWEWFWAASFLFLSRDGTFPCPVTGSRWWSADLGTGRFVLGGGLAHRNCLEFARKGSLSCLQCCRLVSAEHAWCLPSYCITLTVSLLANWRS